MNSLILALNHFFSWQEFSPLSPCLQTEHVGRTLVVLVYLMLQEKIINCLSTLTLYEHEPRLLLCV